MRAETGVTDTLERAVHLAVELVPGCDHAGVSLVHSNRPIDTPAATSDVIRQADELQYELQQGPCLQSIRDEDTIWSANLAEDPRWPAWGPRVAEFGVHSILSFLLFTDQDTLGALNLYSANEDGFSEDDREDGLALAAHCAVALAAAQDVENLNAAVAARTVIGQAQGILMERFDLDPDQAFALLRRVSQAENTKLHHIAVELVRTRRTPGAA